MTTGAYISGAAHVVFILFLLFGGLFTQSRLPEMSVADVSVLTAEEYAALTRPEVAPDVTSDTVAPPAPEPVEDAPEIAAAPDAPPETRDLARPDAPEPAEAPAEIPTELTPEAEVTDVLPPLEAPPVLDDRPDAPEEATPAPASRVAPEPAAPAPPDVETAPELVEQTAPDALAPEPEPPREAAAPEEATTEIVTEAETPTLAPAASPRPRTRPQRQAAAPEEPADDAIADAVAGAVAEATEEASSAPAAPSGPPLSFGEREAFRVSVSTCWDVDVGGRSADVTVVVAVDMNRDGTVVGNQVRQVSVTGGDAAAQRTAFEKARRAILRCQRGGFPLPADKYDRWRQIEMTFNPEGMRLK